jgi:hypothetical protein
MVNGPASKSQRVPSRWKTRTWASPSSSATFGPSESVDKRRTFARLASTTFVPSEKRSVAPSSVFGWMIPPEITAPPSTS